MVAVNLGRERSIVEDAARADASAPPAERRLGAYYAACMDERGIEARGLAPVRGLLASIDAIRTPHDAVDVVADLQAHDVEALIAAYPANDPTDSAQSVLWLDKGPLGLPDPADYDKTDAGSVQLRARYLEHVGRVLRLLGASEEEARVSAARMLALETTLAKKALSAVERRNHDAQVHPMSVAELGARYTLIDWPAYLAKIGSPPVTRVNVAQPGWLDGVNAMLATNDVAALRDYLRTVVVRWSATLLPGAMENEVFDFRQRTLRGAREIAPRWQRCLRRVDGDLGDDVGRVFVDRYYKADARARMKTMTDALIMAYRADIASRDWLGQPAREAALAKLSKMLLVTGASNRLLSFDGLRVEKDDPVGNAWRAQAFRHADSFAQIGKPTDRERFFDSLPQQLDGFGSKSSNATGFTAGFLQPPIFDPHMDDAVNFGGLGSVIGHELSHHLDDQGRKFDADGNLRPWWSEDDVARFEARAQCFVAEYSRFKTEDGTPLDGKLTLGENIADNGGIRLSYAALRPSETAPVIDGFTPAQRFFLAWGQIRCENVTPETARRQAQTDPHSAGRWRVDGVVANMPEFASAFACPAGSPMAPTDRCSLW